MPRKAASSVPTPSVNKDGSLMIYLQVTGTTADGVQYKPYQTSFVPTEPVYVTVVVDKQHVLSVTPLILTPVGWYLVARRLATASMRAADMTL